MTSFRLAPMYSINLGSDTDSASHPVGPLCRRLGRNFLYLLSQPFLL